MFGKVLILCSVLNLGDVDHTNQIFSHLSHHIKPLQKYEINANETPDLLVKNYLKVTQTIENENYVILAVGEKGLKALQYLHQSKLLNTSSAYIAASLHQYMDTVNNIPLDYLAVPEATLDTPEKRTAIEKIPAYTLTFAVPTNNPTIEELKASYNQWDETVWESPKPSLKNRYIIVMLPGDAPDPAGKMHYFTQESAKLLFDDVVLLWERYGKTFKILVHNSPRTGKHDPETGQEVCLHEYQKGQNPTEAVDAISRYFVSLVKEKGLPYSFFNFAFEKDGSKRRPLSVFQPFLYIAHLTDSFFILPGESVSMLGQLPLYLSPERVVVFKPNSMNEEHEAIFNLAVQRGYVSYFSPTGGIIPPQTPRKRDEDDTPLIVRDLVKGYRKKFREKL